MAPHDRPSEPVRIAADAAHRLVEAIFTRVGCVEREASAIARGLVGANLRGHDSHGVIRTPRYLQWIDTGRQAINQDLTVISGNDVMALVDGNFGFGQSIGEQAVDLGIEKARLHGVSVVGLRNSGHLGRIGEWAEQAAAAGMASIHSVNVRGGLIVAPFGATERRGCTSPFCLGMPRAGHAPIVHDFATSMVAEGKALVALKGGKPLPPGAVVDGEGNLTADPSSLYGDLGPADLPDPSKGPGALTTFGGHKGSGLNFFMEMLGGALSGSGVAAVAGESERRRFCNGMLSVYFDLDHFHDAEWMAGEVNGYLEFFKSAVPRETGGEVLAPGELELRTLAEREREGIPLAPVAWDDLCAAARRVGLADAEIETLAKD